MSTETVRRGTRKLAKAPIPATQKSQETAPHLEFLNRAQGSLPEILSEADLGTLNSALGVLFGHLREAGRQFINEDDDGRSGAYTALAGLYQFIMLFKEPLSERLHVPIIEILNALRALDNNHVLPMVEPVRRRGRAPSSDTYAALKGFAAGTVRRLAEAGLFRSDARKAVAKQLNQISMRSERGSGKITATTIRNWCNEVSADVGRHGIAAMTHDSMFARPQEQERYAAMQKGEARHQALASFTAWVQTFFPNRKKLVNPPI